MVRTLELVAGLLLSAHAASQRGPVFDFAAQPTLDQLRAVKFLPVPDGITAHAHEERGFVSVPMDYARAGRSPRLRIFYRLMPAGGSTAGDTHAPIVVVVNGGPGAPSSMYRPYDYDYDHPTPRMQRADRLGELLTRFRVLIVDQRGTSGNSAPLDLNDPDIDPVIVARYFDSVHHALDLQEVIRAVVPEHEPFYVLAQSYAGLIGMRYLTLPAISRKPRGIVFSSAALPHVDTLTVFQSRRREQRALHLQLLRAEPAIEDLLARLGTHFRDNGFDAGSVHYLWSWLGKGPPGTWERALREKVEALLQADRQGLQEFLDREAIRADLLNYILSAKELTPGFTDRTQASLLVKRVPFEGWMLDEQWSLQRLRGDAGWVAPVLDALDRSPPPLDPAFPSVARIRRELARRHVLFTFGEGDAFLGGDAPQRAAVFTAGGKSRVLVLPGGHSAIFLPRGAEAIASWIASLPPVSGDWSTRPSAMRP